MILVDANLLSYAVDSDAPHHARARRWLEDVLSSGEPVGLAWMVLLAFLRVTTRDAILVRPLHSTAALAYGPNHWPILRNLLRTAGTLGNLTSDAHLAALAIERGAALYSTDHDFMRFPGVKTVNPLSE